MHWFEDTPMNEVAVLGDYTFTEENIVSFARKYDPQIFHLDPVAAKRTAFGGLVASGWHTLSVWIKLLVEYRDRMAAQMQGEMPNKTGVSPGQRKIHWHKPVRPGTTLTYTYETIGKEDWPSRPELGLVLRRCEARDGQGELYLSFINTALLKRRPK